MIDWNYIFIAIGGFTAFLTFVFGMLRTEKKPVSQPDEWKQKVSTEQALVKEQLSHMKKDIEDLKRSLHQSDEKTLKTLEKFETRIEKLTEIIIEHIKRN